MDVLLTGMFYQAAFVFVTGVFGMVLLSYLLLKVLKTPMFHNSFGYFCVTQLIAGVGIQFLFAFVIAVETIYPQFLPTRLIVIVSYTIMALSYVVHYTNLLLGLNRFSAVFRPISYSKIFTNYNGKWMVAITWVLSFVQCSVLLVEGCHFTFRSFDNIFSFDEEPCGILLNDIMDRYYNTGVAVLQVIIDACTMLKLVHGFRATKQKNSRMSLKKFSRGELRQFTQSVLSSSMYIGVLLCFHIGGASTQDVFLLFWLAVYVWQIYYCLQGLLMLLIYAELRRAKTPHNTLVTVVSRLDTRMKSY